MQPTEWAVEWEFPLVHLNQANSRLPSLAREFLVRYGLPSVVIFEWQHPFEISFAVLEKELVAYVKEMKWGDFYDAELDHDWRQQIVIGQEEFCNGHASFCVHEVTGKVIRIDCEISEPNCFVNSDIERFGRALLAAKKWSASKHIAKVLPSADAFNSLVEELRSIDPPAFEYEQHYWPNLLEAVRENPDKVPLHLLITNDPAKSMPRF